MEFLYKEKLKTDTERKEIRKNETIQKKAKEKIAIYNKNDKR